MDNLKHSPVLFITDDGECMQFYIPPRILEKYENIKHLIEHGSGIVETTPCREAIHLIENETKILPTKEGEQFVKIQFVLDCVAANTLYDINDYVISIKSEDVSDISDQEEGEIINHAKGFCKSGSNNIVKVLTEQNIRTLIKKEKKWNRNCTSWTIEEDRKVIDFILRFPHNGTPEEKYVMFQLMSKNKIVKRSESAIANRMYYILGDIKCYGLTNKDEEKLISRVCILKKNAFTMADDLKMINYIIKHKYYKNVTGKSIYKQMIKDKVIIGKNPMAMYKRFITKILPNLDEYQLLPQHMDKFINRNEYKYFSSEDDVEYEVSSGYDNGAVESKNNVIKRKKKSKHEKASKNATVKPEFKLSEKNFFKVEKIDPDFLESDDDFYETKKKKEHVENNKIRAFKRSSKNKPNDEPIGTYVSLPVKRKKLFNLRENYLENVDIDNVSSSNLENNNFTSEIKNDATTNVSHIRSRPCENSDSKIKSESLELHTCELLNNNQEKLGKWYDTSLYPFSLPDTIDDELCGSKTNCKILNGDMYITRPTNCNEVLKVSNGNDELPELCKRLASNKVVSSKLANVNEENVHNSASNENMPSIADQIVIPDTYDSQNVFNECQDEKIKTVDKNENVENSFAGNSDPEECDSTFYEKANAILGKMKPVISNMQSSDEDKDTLLKYVDELHLLLYKNKHKQCDFN